MRAKVIGIVQRKGGVGKTTETLNLAFEAALAGKRTLVIDADPQSSLAVGWSEDRESTDPLPNGMSIISMCTTKIHRDIRAISNGFDLVLIDGPPRSTGITRSIMLASDMIIIPCTPSGLDVKASKKTIAAAYEAREYLGDLKIVFSINRKSVNTALGKTIRESLCELDDDIVVLNAEICMRVAFAEAMSTGMAIQELDGGSKARLEIKDLYTEIMGILDEER
jgi:chromosome partitioning protein